MNEYRLQIVIDLLDCERNPVDITRKLGITPDVSHQKGEIIANTGRRRQRTMWMLYSKASAYDADEEEHIAYLRKLIDGKEYLFREISKECKSVVTILINNEDNFFSGMTIDQWLIRLAAAMNADIEIDFFRSRDLNEKFYGDD